jgi:hypothetical protein
MIRFSRPPAVQLSNPIDVAMAATGYGAPDVVVDLKDIFLIFTT